MIAGQVAEACTSLAAVAPWLWLTKRVKLAELPRAELVRTELARAELVGTELVGVLWPIRLIPKPLKSIGRI